MAIVKTNPTKLDGQWTQGTVLDRHVISAVPTHYIGEHLQFDTERSPLGELVYRLKNRGGSTEDIVDTAVGYLTNEWTAKIDVVIAPPPSIARPKQPATTLAREVAQRIGADFSDEIVTRVKQTEQMKNVDRYKRPAMLAEAIQPGSVTVAGKSVLVVDDLWETGSTMRRVTDVLSSLGAKEIRVLVMTKTK